MCRRHALYSETDNETYSRGFTLRASQMYFTGGNRQCCIHMKLKTCPEEEHYLICASLLNMQHALEGENIHTKS